MRNLITGLAVASIVALSSSAALAQGSQSSAKATAVVTNLNVLDASTLQAAQDDGWQTIMQNTVKTSEQKDLFVDVSLESGLYTKTQVKSKGGTRDTSVASASVKVRVLIDGNLAYPSEIVFNKRAQHLSAVFQGLLQDESGNSCLAVDLETGAIVIDEDCLLPEEVELILDTMSANSFNFLYPDAGTGVHTVSVQAKIETDTSFESGSAEAAATIGHGSVTVEEVRMIKEEDFEL